MGLYLRPPNVRSPSIKSGIFHPLFVPKVFFPALRTYPMSYGLVRVRLFVTDNLPAPGALDYQFTPLFNQWRASMLARFSVSFNPL